MDKKALLQWYLDAGVDETIGETPADQFALSAKPPPAAPKKRPHTPAASLTPATAQTVFASPSATAATASPLHHTPSAAMAAARQAADQAGTLAELEAAVRAFDGCAIKKTASKTVFADGNPQGQVMIIGEAPGAQEDRQGIPFCGPSGMLLDRMLAAIRLDRTSVYISNTVFWRPPGNRQPSLEETSICLPFVEKHIALAAPKLLILSGGTAATTLLNKDSSISRLRNRFYDYHNQYLQSPITATVLYHPSYLLRSPQQKRLAWHDLQMIEKFLKNVS